MKIAQIAPLMESVPPRFYGGTERIVSYLTEELVRLGHEVTLFASRDSMTAASLVPCVPQALRLNSKVCDTVPYYMLMLDQVRRRADKFDVLHFHIDLFHFPIFRDIAARTLTTLHGRQDLPDLNPLYSGFPTCRWFRSRIRNGVQCPMQTSLQTFRTVFPITCSARFRIAAVAMSHSSGAWHRRSGPIGQSSWRVP